MTIVWTASGTPNVNIFACNICDNQIDGCSENSISVLVKPKAEINLKKGKWITMVAKEGIFDIEKQTLELMGDVLFLHSDGQQIDTNNAVIDLKKAKIYGNKSIFGKAEAINFSSEGFEVNKTGQNFKLLGKSKLKIKKLKNN